MKDPEKGYINWQLSVTVTAAVVDDLGRHNGRLPNLLLSREFPESRSFSLRKAAFALPSPSTAAPRSGAEDTHGRDGPGTLGASIDEYAGEEDALSHRCRMADRDLRRVFCRG